MNLITTYKKTHTFKLNSASVHYGAKTSTNNINVSHNIIFALSYEIMQPPPQDLNTNKATTNTSVTTHNGSDMQSCDIVYKYTSVCGSVETQVTCAEPISYTATVCQQELNSLKACLLPDVESIHPLVVTDSELSYAETALSSVDSLASDACAVEVKPFLCLYFFGLCDSASGVTYQPTAGHCRNLRDEVCELEWNVAVSFGLELPDCDTEFSEEIVPCNAVSGEEGK